MALQFLDQSAAGINFGESIIKTHPELRKVKDFDINNERKRVINYYFNNYYQVNKRTLKNNLNIFKKEWRKKEKEFFHITEDFFGGFGFKKGMYICYLSIIDCNPRFLESKTFQVFYKKTSNEAIHTIAHELLHFIFFDFIGEKLKKEVSFLSEEQIWDLSEIFNVVVLESNLYKNIIAKNTIYPYPSHKKYLPLFRKAYRNCGGAEEFILKGIQIFSKLKKE